jgi:hypothetical protein
MSQTAGVVPLFSGTAGRVRWLKGVGEVVNVGDAVCDVAADPVAVPPPAVSPRATMIVCYFGSLPGWFPVFARSCGANPWLTVTVVGDARPPAGSPGNVVHVPMSFDEVVRRVDRLIGGGAAIVRPYKLCDVRPAYAEIFPELVDGFDWWGWGDVDVVHGDLTAAVADGLRGPYSMLLTQGSLCLCRNTPQMRQLYRGTAPDAPTFDEVVRDPANRIFDEAPGLHRIAASQNVPVFRNATAADVNSSPHRMTLANPWFGEADYPHQVFVWREGRVFREAWDGDRFLRREFGYVHLQKRRLPTPPAGVLSAPAFAITPSGFVQIESERPSREEMARLNPSRPLSDAWFKLTGPIRRVRRLRAERQLRRQHQSSRPRG